MKNIKVDYFKFGQGEETFVILPGLSVQSVMGFAGLVADAYKVLGDNYTCYLFDRNKELPETYSIHEMAEDSVSAIKELCLKKVNLFGASQGGMMAMDIAINHPELVSKLVLGSTSAALNSEQFETIDKWIDLARQGTAKACTWLSEKRCIRKRSTSSLKNSWWEQPRQ